MKRVLVISYSQSGQLDEIVRSVVGPLRDHADFLVHHLQLQPIPDYPFPWRALQFCDAFPEAFSEIPCQLSPMEGFSDQEYDLIILAWTVWFLSPSIPISSFLQSEAGHRLLRGKRVVSLIGCRNMWTMAYDKVKKRIEANEGNLAGNIVLTERTSNLMGILTIAVWMLRGTKERFLGIFPQPGIDRRDIQAADRFGECIRQTWTGEELELKQEQLLALGAVTVDPALVFMEKRVSSIFRKWSVFIRAKGGPGSPERRKRVRAFLIYLLSAVVFLAPISRIVAWLWGRVGKKHSVQEIAKYQKV